MLRDVTNPVGLSPCILPRKCKSGPMTPSRARNWRQKSANSALFPRMSQSQTAGMAADKCIIYSEQAFQSKHDETLPVSLISQVMKMVWKVTKIAEEEQNTIWLLAPSITQISQSLNVFLLVRWHVEIICLSWRHLNLNSFVAFLYMGMHKVYFIEIYVSFLLTKEKKN